VAEGRVGYERDNGGKQREGEGDALFDLRTHLTAAILAAGYLHRAGADCDDATRERVHEHLQHAHEALREAIAKLPPLLPHESI
jgi:hypothetical protein